MTRITDLDARRNLQRLLNNTAKYNNRALPKYESKPKTVTRLEFNSKKIIGLPY